MDENVKENLADLKPGRPERPFRYVYPVVGPDGSVGYDEPPENYFDASMAPRLLPSQPPSDLYDTIARAHDHRFQVSQDMLDPGAPTLLCLNQPERPRPLVPLPVNSVDYMDISPATPESHPRRPSFEDHRDAIGVTPGIVNPIKLPVDTNISTASDAAIDARTKQTLADLGVGLVASQPSNTTVDATVDATEPQPSLTKEDSFTFDYDTESELDAPATAPLVPAQPTQEAAQVEDSISHVDMDIDDDSDSDTDMSSHDERDWDTIQRVTKPEALRWLIPPRRRSVVAVEKEDIATDASPPSSDNEHTGKRHGSGAKTAPIYQYTTRYANDTPTQHPSDAHAKLYPCLLDGCSKICASPGGLHRHQQSLQHHAPSHPCLSCGKSYSRPDALKRHFKSRPSCKRIHATKMSENADENQEQMETDKGAA